MNNNRITQDIQSQEYIQERVAHPWNLDNSKFIQV